MNIALIGYGKMGKTIEQVIAEEYAGNCRVVLRIDSQKRNTLDIATLQNADVAIEFTAPHAAADNLLFCLEAGVPVVCGTTGWLSRFEEVRQMCVHKGGALVYASNFSIGVNLFFELNRWLAQLMRPYPHYRPEIEETHHLQKKDSPSGTAVTLAEAVVSESQQLQKWVNHPVSKPDELPLISHRIADVKGTHIVRYQSAIDTIEISHTAHSRLGFAQGAVLAAAWVLGKKGIFTMRDVLHLGV
ncbi:4-hydroxy-tetrahydrodipicolinate reductase [Sphingobacteriales bacterium UPWRP_1]|nr:4-hydroxy-tetrahydrodipicolinate reductase [Sphingobacteriales bacterium TSM_CSM]PSJ77827.1 4-hydroxy-tetrahydrodipicolinate reductase [Sphingobacteriales bacterium UPWRP_1]